MEEAPTSIGWPKIYLTDQMFPSPEKRGKKEHMMQQTLGKFYSFTERLQEISGLVRYLIIMLLQYNGA